MNNYDGSSQNASSPSSAALHFTDGHILLNEHLLAINMRLQLTVATAVTTVAG
jgi:hypothetical protein